MTEYQERQGDKIAKWLYAFGATSLTTKHGKLRNVALMKWAVTKPGTGGREAAYRALCEAGAAHAEATGQRCEADLSPQLIGLEGHRVEVDEPDQESLLPGRVKGGRRRFIVGKSTGWMPCHLEIAQRNSSGGGAANKEYTNLVDLERVR